MKPLYTTVVCRGFFFTSESIPKNLQETRNYAPRKDNV